MAHKIKVNCSNVTEYYRSKKAQANDTSFEAGRTINGVEISNIRTEAKLSGGAMKRFKKYMHVWLSTVESVRVNAMLHTRSKRPQSLSKFLSFITLTLPSKQLHSDRELKVKLNKFIKYLRPNYNLGFTYIWFAEKTKRGRLHFHLIIDGYYNKFVLLRDWNRHLPAEYIDNFEAAYGHRNPPSARVDSIKKGVEKYLIKDAFKQFQKEGIDGKLWDCSNNLKQLNEYHDYSDRHQDYLTSFSSAENIQVYKPAEVEKQYYAIMWVKGFSPLHPTFIDSEVFRDFYANQFSSLYPNFSSRLSAGDWKRRLELYNRRMR